MDVAPASRKLGLLLDLSLMQACECILMHIALSTRLFDDQFKAGQQYESYETATRARHASSIVDVGVLNRLCSYALKVGGNRLLMSCVNNDDDDVRVMSFMYLIQGLMWVRPRSIVMRLCVLIPRILSPGIMLAVLN